MDSKATTGLVAGAGEFFLERVCARQWAMMETMASQAKVVAVPVQVGRRAAALVRVEALEDSEAAVASLGRKVLAEVHLSHCWFWSSSVDLDSTTFECRYWRERRRRRERWAGQFWSTWSAWWQ